MMKGPGIFLAQFMSDDAPLNQFDTACKWASELGYLGVQVPSWDGRCMDLQKAAESKDYCQELMGQAEQQGVEISELATHLQGQLVGSRNQIESVKANFEKRAPEFSDPE